jgi:phosphoribosyl-AMP cyclohydrolase
MKKELLEEGLSCHLNFEKVEKVGKLGKKLIHVIVQEDETGEVLMSAFADRRAISYSLKNRIVTLWSTSRQKFWIKGKTSGNYLEIVETLTDCDQDEILFKVKMKNEGACHTRARDGRYRKSCFYRRIVGSDGRLKLELIKE